MSYPQMRAAIMAVIRERARQVRLKHEGRFQYMLSDPEMSDATRLQVLVEEVGEVARALQQRDKTVNDRHDVELRNELVQVCAIALAWVERLS